MKLILTPTEISALHTKLIAKTGGSDGLRDMGLLESAVYSAEASFGGEEVYPHTEEKAARLMYALVSNHAFIDGNKRIGILVMLVLLRLNGIQMSYTQAELTELGMSAGAGKLRYEDVLFWIRSHTAQKQRQ